MSKRPPGVPADYVSKPCAGCGRETWYPSGAEASAVARGAVFVVACQKDECVRATQDRIARALYPHKNSIDPLWDEAARNPGKVIDISRRVACDECGDEYTDSKGSGGFIWLNRATCPKCANNVLQVLPTQKLKRLLNTAWLCPSEMSFADFVREVRGPNATIKVPPRGTQP